MEEIVVRPATPDELDVLIEFEQAIIDAERSYDLAIRTEGDVRYYDLMELVRSPDVEIVVAEINDTVIGCGYARIEASKAYLKHQTHSYLGFMYVLPEYRGRGVNSLILAALESWSASKGVGEMKLEVYLENASALRAYEKAGYRGDVIQMHKALSES